MAKVSSGLLVWRRRAGRVEVLLAHPGGPFFTKKDDGVWTVPKGEHDPGEDPLEAAVREYVEEIGIAPPAGARVSLGEARQSSGKLNMVWAVEGDVDISQVNSNMFSLEWPPRSGRLAEFPEVDRAEWFDLEAARVKIRPAQAPFLERLATHADKRQALSFGAAADHYDKVRPSYPDEAITWALGRGRARVADLGAGTGIFSRQLAAAGHDVVPVEPDPGMRARLVGVAPELSPLDGTAEKIPLPDASVDAVTAAQAYHWFDRTRAHAEIARVLRPDGVFCPLWNVRDDAEPWVAELSRIFESVRQLASLLVTPDFGDAFHPAELATFSQRVTHTPESLVELVRSRSFYLTADAAGRADIEARVRALTAGHPDLAGRAEFELPYVTVVYRARRRS